MVLFLFRVTTLLYRHEYSRQPFYTHYTVCDATVILLLTCAAKKQNPSLNLLCVVTDYSEEFVAESCYGFVCCHSSVRSMISPIILHIHKYAII